VRMVNASGGVVVGKLLYSSELDGSAWELIWSWLKTKFLDDVVNDLKSLSFNIIKLFSRRMMSIHVDSNTPFYCQFNKWVAFVKNFLSDPACSKCVTQLNEHFLEKAVLVGGGYTPSEADILVFSTIHPYKGELLGADTSSEKPK
nr:aminoacyl tRNA synthase complex-interacting multifunctional protein 1 isoform X1 [Tanacetum cinerariifolium]